MPPCGPPCGTPDADPLVRRVPAVRPDRVRALCASAGLLALTGVDDLEVVDVPILLVEVAVAVDVVAILLVERVQIRLDLRVRLAGRLLVGSPLVIASRIRYQTVEQTLEPQTVFWP